MKRETYLFPELTPNSRGRILASRRVAFILKEPQCGKELPRASHSADPCLPAGRFHPEEATKWLFLYLQGKL